MSSELISGQSPKILTPEYAGKLLFYSFKYSQGDKGCQRLIYRYQHKLHPEWQFTADEFFEDAVAVAAGRAMNLFKPVFEGNNEKPAYHAEKGKHSTVKFTPKDIPLSIRDEMELMRLIYGETDPGNDWGSIIQFEWQVEAHKEPGEVLAERLTHAITGRDYYFLVEENGRDYKNTNLNKPAGDPWSSHIIDYALKSKNTGLHIYDQMFGGIRKYILGPHDSQRGFWAGDISLRLPEITQVYNLHHPTDPSPVTFR